MNNKDYKRALDQIKPDHSLREKVWQGLDNKSSFSSRIRIGTISFAAIFILSIVSLNVLPNSGMEKKDRLSKSSKMEKKSVSDEFIGFDGTKGETIKSEESLKDRNFDSNGKAKNGSALKSSAFGGLGNNAAADSARSNANTDMSIYQTGSIGMLEFEGKTYREDNDNYSYNILKLKGEKLGTTKISFQKGYKGKESFKDEPFHPNNKDLELYPDGYEIYSVKGYNPEYRIMVSGNSNGDKWGSIYNCFTEKKIATGEDVFSNIYLKGNIKSARWKTIESWRNKLEVYKNIELSTTFEDFIDALYISKPLPNDSLSNSDFDKSKILYLTMKNQIVEQIWLFPDSKFVKYQSENSYFKVEDRKFDAFYKTLK